MLIADRNIHGHRPESSSRPWRAALAGVLLAAFAGDAAAALSRWSASNNRIYVYGGGTMTLTDISATTPGLPADALQRVDAGAGIWLLNANIIVEEGTTLALTGDVRELRMKSTPSTAPATDVTNFVSITAGNFDTMAGTGSPGAILIDGIKVTSWDGDGPDTNSADGRSFIRARSAIVAGIPQISRLDVLNSEVQYLGYESSERYGLSWKANGDLGVVHVLGDVKNSNIHHNHYGVYSFGLKNGQWTGNTVSDNDGYGFDAHDDSDNLVIDGNTVERNGLVDPKGKHGIILSERCDGAQITNNTASANGGNGIMLHDFGDDAIIEGNTAKDNADAGVAIFCSSGTLVKNNTLQGNKKYGIRLTVASRDNVVENNQILDNGSPSDTTSGYGIFMQPATDSNGICGSDLTPRNNTFTGNTVAGNTTAGVKITDGTANTFIRNTFGDGVSIRNSTGATEQTVTFQENAFNSGVVVRLDGAANLPLRANFSKSPRVSLEVDTGSTARFTDDAGAIFDLTRDLLVSVEGSNSSIDLRSDNAGAAFVVDTRKLHITTDGSLVEAAPTQWETSGGYNKSWIARAQNASGTVQYRVGDLEPGVSYDARRNGTTIGAFVAGGDGFIAFSDAPGATATQTYTIVRSAVQPQGGGGGGGGGGGALDLSLLALLALLPFARRRLQFSR